MQTMSAAPTSSPADRVYRAWWQDGGIDLFAGLGLVGIGITWLLDAAVFGAVLPALAVPLWKAYRERVVEPRLGRVRFAEPRRRSLHRAQLTLIAAGVACLAISLAGWFASREGTTSDAWRALVPALPAALVGLAGLLSALLFGQPRLLGYALACVLFGLAGAALDLEPGWTLLAGGIVTALSGALLLRRFLRTFPVLSNELD